MTRILLILSCGVLSSLASASEPVVSDSGSDVVVSIVGVVATGAHATPRGDQLEIAIAPGATPHKFLFDDVTVKRVEITPDTLLITVHHSRESTVLTAQQAQRAQRIAGLTAAPSPLS